MKKFQEYSRFDLSEINKEMLKKWDENDVFHKSLATREGKPSFVILRRTSFCQRFARYSPRDGSFDQGYFLSVQNHEGFSRKT